MKYIDVVVDNKSEQTDSFFTYLAPDELQVGTKVSVSFGKRKKSVDGYCVAADVEPKCCPDVIKEIDSYDEDRSLNEEMINTALWMRQRYGVKYIDSIKMFTVAGKREAKAKHVRSESHGNPQYSLSTEQQNAVDIINSQIEKNKFNSFLIKGVTNSGKTEVYIRSVEKALDMGKTAIILLPEIALSEQVLERFKLRFGEKEIATLHSKLSTSRKLEEWLRIKRGEARIVIGARTSVFAPLDNIGVIVIDEEHESTYKSDHNPKYDTIDVAYRRAESHNAALILGSATPSVVSYNRAQNGIYKLIEMNNRIGDSVMPDIHLVDMRQEARSGNLSVLSRRLVEEINVTLNNKEQVILFLNRRGYSTQIMCPDCGYHMTCPDCGITLTYHKSNNSAVCHYCGRKHPIPSKCPDCGSKFIRYIGAGTEKVEECVKELWPCVGVARFDLDTAGNGDDINKVIGDFQEGKTDILVGTQILAKGLDFRNVGLVGVINADVSLNIPDYRSSERTYQLITQVAGRAGRTGGKSRVIIQTYEPDSDIIIDAANSDYENFYESEILHRNLMNYPPFTDIISICMVSDDAETAMKFANAYRDYLVNMKDKPLGSVILKPREEERKIDGKSKVSFIIKAPLGSRAGYVRLYMEFRERMIKNKSDCFIEIDINPYGIA